MISENLNRTRKFPLCVLEKGSNALDTVLIQRNIGLKTALQEWHF